MTRLELLVSHLEAEATPFEVQATQKCFSADIRFCELCMKAKELTLKMPKTGLLHEPKSEPFKPKTGTYTTPKD